MLTIQYEKETIDKNIQTTKKNVVFAKIILQKTNNKIIKYIILETQINALIKKNKTRAKKKNKVYKMYIDQNIMQSS